MPTQIKWEYSLTILLLMISAIILIFMLIQFGFGMNYRSKLMEQLKNTESAGFTMKEIPEYQSSVKAKTDFQTVVDRPLFFKVRRPIEITVDEEVPEISRVSGNFEFILTGIINTPNAYYCLLQNPRAKEAKDKFKRLEEGEVIEGRTIQEIKRDRVIIAYDGKTEEILLAKPRPKRVAKKPKPAKPAESKKTVRKPQFDESNPRPTPATAKRNPFKLRKNYRE